MGSTHRLILQSGTGIGTEYPLEKTELFLGRDPNNDIVINDSEVSRRHARLSLEGNSYKFEDLGSTNGTFIHGQRLVSPIILRPGEVITLGEKVVLRYEVTSSDSNATVVVQRGENQKTQMAATPPVAPPISRTPVPTPPPPAPVPFIQPPAPAYPPISAAPAYPPMAPKKKSKGLIVVLVIVAIVVLLCIIPFIIIDATNSYCALFPGIFNMFFPGACP